MYNYYDLSTHSMNGGPYHRGTCPKCGKDNGTCYDDICDACFELEPVVCKQCGCTVAPDDITEHGVCEYCTEENAQKFTRKFKSRLLTEA